MPNCSVVPREDVEFFEGKTYIPIGTGPFIFKSYQMGKELQFVANENYFGGRPYLDELHFEINSDEEAQFNNFIKGKIFHTSVPDPEYTKLRMSKNWAPYFTEVSQLGTYYIGMNLTKAPFDNPLVRKAISMAVDKSVIVKYIRAGRVLCAKGPLPPGLPSYNTSLNVPPFSPDKAEEILDLAGFPRDGKNGLRSIPQLHLNIPRGESDMRVARAIQANLADIGIDCVPVANEWQVHLKLVNQGHAPFFRLGWVADYLDADSFLYYEFHSSNIGVSNSCNYRNAKVDELLTLARSVLEKTKREEYYKEAEQLIVNDCVWICLYYYNTALVRQPFVHGLNLTPLGDHMIRYDAVWLDDITGTGKEAVNLQ
jgi:ABC-type transport system substrate-binding protein